MKPEDILKKMIELKTGKEEPVPKGYYTVEQLAQTAGLSTKTINARCLELVRLGKLKKLSLRRMRTNGSISKVNFYGA